MGKSYLTLLFTGLSLSGCAIPFDSSYPQRNSSAYRSPSTSGLRMKNIEELWDYAYPDKRIRNRDKQYSIKSDLYVKLVDYSLASSKIKEACTKPITEPLTPQPSDYSGNSYVRMEYDVNEFGNPVNIFIDNMNSKGTDLIKNNSFKDVKNSKFEPPTYGGQKLFCRNISEYFSWSNPGFLQREAIRQRGNHMVSSHQNLMFD